VQVVYRNVAAVAFHSESKHFSNALKQYCLSLSAAYVN